MAVTLAATIVGVAVLGYVAVNHYNGNISRIAGAIRLPGKAAPPKAPRNASNYLLVGSDSRAGLKAGPGTPGKVGIYKDRQSCIDRIERYYFANDTDQMQPDLASEAHTWVGKAR